MLLDLAPGGCFGIEAAGRVVATAALVRYGTRLGWIGMVLTHPEFRGRGLAGKLVEQVLARADEIGIRTLKLDATEQGRPLYEKHGFKSEQAVERWGGKFEGERGATRPGAIASWRDVDVEAFGVQRWELVNALMERGKFVANSGGYLVTRPGRVASYVGPCVASNLDKARELMCSGVGSGEWYWDLFPENNDAVTIARELGFTRRRSLTRMFRGEEFRGRDELVYAIAGFEWG